MLLIQLNENSTFTNTIMWGTSGLHSVEQIEHVLEGCGSTLDNNINDVLEVAKQERLNLRDVYCYLMSEGEAKDMEYNGLIGESTL